MSERTDNATESGTHAVGPGMVVAMHYDLYTAEAEKIETSKGGNPILFLFGDSSVLAALQEALDGKLAGDDFSVTIPHEKAYGRRYPDRMRRMPRKQIDGGKKQTFRPGQVIHLRNEQGPTHATIVKAGKFMIDLDMNHSWQPGVDRLSAHRPRRSDRQHNHRLVTDAAVRIVADPPAIPRLLRLPGGPFPRLPVSQTALRQGYLSEQGFLLLLLAARQSFRSHPKCTSRASGLCHQHEISADIGCASKSRSICRE